MRTAKALLVFLWCVSAAGSQIPNSVPPAPGSLPKAAASPTPSSVGARRAQVAALTAEGRAATPKALQLLEASQAEDRAAGVFILAAIRAEETVPRISKLLMTDPVERVRMQAADAIGALGAADGVSALLVAVESDESRDVRVRAITSLGRIDSPAVSDPIRRQLQSPKSDAEFQAAAIAAGRRHLAAAEPALIAASTDTARSDHARGAATLALGLIGGGTALSAVVDLLEDASPVVRFNAIGAVDEMQAAAATARVTKVFANAHEEKFVRIRAASAMARIGTRESLAPLRAMAASSDEFMAMHSVVALLNADRGSALRLALRLRDRASDPFVVQIASRIVQGQPLPWGQR